MSLYFTDHILFLIIGILLPSISIYSSQGNTKNIELNRKEKCQVYLGNSLILFILAILVLANWYFLDRPFSDIGIRNPQDSKNGLSIILLILFIGLYLADTFFSLFPQSRKHKTIEKWKKRSYILPVSKQEFYCFIVLSVSAGVCEEIMFRGFLITYLYNLLGTSKLTIYIAVFVPAFLFGIAHAYQGTHAVIKVVLMAVIFGFVYVLSGSIIWLIIIHILVDIIGGILAKEFFVKPDLDEVNTY
ncbi:MAG: CPBP family intramembrane metalloprotease [Saprospiraceae bacterium]|nr:CPBP family intramembrane metalloprotease [Saprospiraceae bacterium]